ncbi:histidine phosphatase family protein [Trinickia caryophylli]|uniref:Phosphoglycerate mutase n=1 Tax=Trinickia caryophylli TaxID=28094 RepID=A0A1X7CBH6_TRICW|nr:histidine phosphatase family protein [Trinickia caryophylli]PMS12465.1 histidine phosphatase family protein [Trinickia caryophylli]TRX19665.1 histidine phosphatase family protein [Trinickia caryophylli]WQE13020.1 histidine phosphatase family protein [Trinickia caryophylli]SME93570.1 phosphoglycerate mutase [Trinickia caryophylli]GLU30754.1 phosphoglycerate mutase [Trinickia caryophylli]
MTTRILFIRHGETEWNRVKRIQGHIDIPLAQSGVAQADRLAARLEREARDGSGLDAIYASDLTRARQTAQPSASVLGLPLQLVPGLRERHYGAFQGLERHEIAARFPEAYAVWQTRDAGFVPEGGESSRAFYDRVLSAVADVVVAHPQGRIACVTHGGVLDCIYRRARGLSLDVPRSYPLLNASINTVEFDREGRVDIVSWGDVDHLGEAADDDGLQPRRAAAGR